MVTLPTLETERLLLRPYVMSDAPELRRLIGAREVAQNMLAVPHPYTTSMAEEWIAGHSERRERGESLQWAITRRADGALLGGIGMELTPEHARAEFGYWLGVPYWRQGYCTEAARAVVDYAFGTLGLQRVEARHFAGNVASGRVMLKLGMTHEGVLRQRVLKWGQRIDLVCYGLLRSEWSCAASSDPSGSPNVSSASNSRASDSNSAGTTTSTRPSPSTVSPITRPSEG